MELILVISISYLMGSIPFGLILTKVFLKKDIRDIGSGNIGATNVLRTGNKLIGYLTLILDVLKAAVPVLYIKFNFPELVYISALSAFIGHVFPVWLKFKGGKGIATYLGIIIALSFKLGIIFTVTWLLISFIFRYSSLASMISGLAVLIYSIILEDNGQSIFLFIIFIIILYTHRENIIRLKDSKETKIKL